MNIFQVKKNSYEFTEDQLSELFKVIDEYAKSDSGLWLNDLDYKRCKYLWGPSLENSYVLAAKPLIGNTVVAQPNGNNPTYWVYIIAPSIIHELRHLWQIKEYGVLIYSVCSALSRIFLLFSEDLYCSTLLEKQAFKDEDESRFVIGGV